MINIAKQLLKSEIDGCIHWAHSYRAAAWEGPPPTVGRVPACHPGRADAVLVEQMRSSAIRTSLTLWRGRPDDSVPHATCQGKSYLKERV